MPLADLGLSWLANPTATVTFIHTQVEDLYTGTSWTNDRASSYSIFTSDLNEAAQFADVRPNVLTFERNYSYLLPRAISYSAGLLNYYFRGVLDVEDMTSQGSAVTLTIRNASLPNYGFSGSPGATEPDFQLYYDTMNGQRQLVTLVNNDLGTGQLAAGATHEFTFNEPNDLDRTKEKPYVLVFNGIVGTELAVVAKAFGTGSGGFIVTPKYPTGDGITGSRTIRWNGSNWIRTAEVGLQGGGADWQGHDPVDVLSFDGVGRYFGARANGVYMNGHVLTGGPGPGSTLGASIRYVDGVRTLNIVKWSVGDRIDVYSRRFADRYTDEDMWTEENQMGWRLVYSGTGGAPFTGFFFNASGTEGQYITIDPANGGPRTRVKITLAGAGGSAVELPAVATVQRTDRTVVSTENDTDVTAGTCEAVSPHHGEPHSDPNDACRSTGLQGVYTATSTRTLTETYSDRTILCVDYRGDEEVLCELLPPDQAVVETRTIQIHRGVDRFNTSPLGSETCPAERHDADQTTQDTTTQSETRWLRVGDAVIPWTSTTGTQTHSLSAIGSFIPSTNFEISDSGSGNSQHRTTKLIHADARHNLAVYESRTDESAGSWQAGVSQSANYSRTEVVMQVGAQQSVLYESEETSAPTGVHQNHGGPPLPVDCLSYNDLTDTPTVSSVTDSAGGVNLFRSNMWSHGSYAVDRAGRIAGSLLILFQSPGGLPVTHGYRNFLTEGDLPGLFPGIPSPDGHGYEIKVIR